MSKKENLIQNISKSSASQIWIFQTKIIKIDEDRKEDSH